MGFPETYATVISIHAPTRGATMDRPQSLSFCAISIHAPTRGATRADIDAALSTQDFNPRSHKGSDYSREDGRTMPDYISIHAPTRGATKEGRP